MSISKKTFALRRAETGFSLMEVLVAMLILAIGLLGLAALQTQGVRFSNDSLIRTQGTYIAYDIIDKMRVNRSNAANYTTKNFPPKNPLGSYDCDPLSATIANDLSCWLKTVELVLPQGQATIEQQVAPDDKLFDITINWWDRQFNNEIACEAQTKRTWNVQRKLCQVEQIWTVWP